jgi:hypothetical protein
LKLVVNGSGFAAFTVHAGGAVATVGTYSITVQVDAPFYSVANSATAFADACTGGTIRTLKDKTGSPAPVPQDEGITDPISAPAGFTYYGAATTSFVVSSNGFLSFDTTIIDSGVTPAALPDGVGATSIAPLWDDLDQVVVCTKTVGSKLVVQWIGVEFSFFGINPTVAFQAILDPADDSIEFVYGTQQATGLRGVSGVQDRTGIEATAVTTFSAVTPNTSKKLTHP